MASVFGSKSAFNFFQKMNSNVDAKTERKKEDSNIDIDPKQIIGDIVNIVDRTRYGVFESIDKIGPVLGKSLGEYLVAMIFSVLLFCLYLIALLILFFSSIFHNYETMFRWLIPIINFLVEFIKSFL